MAQSSAWLFNACHDKHFHISCMPMYSCLHPNPLKLLTWQAGNRLMACIIQQQAKMIQQCRDQHTQTDRHFDCCSGYLHKVTENDKHLGCGFTFTFASCIVLHNPLGILQETNVLTSLDTKPGTSTVTRKLPAKCGCHVRLQCVTKHELYNNPTAHEA